MKKDLIIISCSARKKKSRGLVKAWDLYDGVIFRVLKKNKIDFNKFDVRIISAKYGFLKPTDKIKYYDLKMNKNRAEILRNVNTKYFRTLLKGNYKKVYFCLGKIYLSTIASNLLRDKKIKIVKGGIGIKMKKLKSITTN
jgi:cytoplasmic iron level regulating protein YaaA (DUF328/UPF0246 family)